MRLKIAHLFLNLSQVNNFIDELGVVLAACHKVFKVKLRMINISLQVYLNLLRTEQLLRIHDQIHTCLIRVRKSNKNVAFILHLLFSSELLDTV